MEGKLTVHSNPNDLLPLKKLLLFIREVVRAYEIGLSEHVGFSCILAIAKVEEIKKTIYRFCPAYETIEELIAALRHLHDQQTGSSQAAHAIEKIHSYFALDRFELVPKPAIISGD